MLNKYSKMADIDYNGLWSEIRKYISLKVEYGKITAIEKGIVLLSAIALAGVLLVLLACVLFYFSFAIVLILGELMGCTWGAYLVVACLFLIVAIVVYSMRKRLIFDPVAKFLTKLFMGNSK